MGMGKINLSKSTFLILFLAVGFFVGVSFTSVYAGIPWGTSEIADNAITSIKIKNQQVKTADVKNKAINSKKIRDGTIQGVDIAPGTLVVTRRADTQTMSPGSNVFFTVDCLSGEQPTGGGWFFQGANKAKAGIKDSNPTVDGWFIQSFLDSSASGDVSVTGYVECIRLQ